MLPWCQPCSSKAWLRIDRGWGGSQSKAPGAVVLWAYMSGVSTLLAPDYSAHSGGSSVILIALFFQFLHLPAQVVKRFRNLMCGSLDFSDLFAQGRDCEVQAPQGDQTT